MRVTRCVWQYHDKKIELQPVFDNFRANANEAIRIGIEKNLTSKYNLHYELYYKFRSEFHSRYVYGALECAASKLKLFRKRKKKDNNVKIPRISKNHLILEKQAYRIKDGQIRIPIKPKQYCHMKLNYYILKQIQNTNLGSLTITENKIIISYSKEVKEHNPSDFVAIDRNLDNATTYDTQNKFIVYNLQKTNQIKQSYRQVKSKFKRNDVRIRKKIFAKYGKKERDRVHNVLHITTKRITSQNMGVILEDIKGIRKLYRKGNEQGSDFRAKMNSWSFYELQRQIEYKARWLGLPVKYVKANGTSSKCAVCGSKTVPEEHRMLFCPCCKAVIDRDVNAAKNILARGTRVVPIGATSEAMMGNVIQSLIPGADVSQSSC
ncbi:MAG: RNA-guided endonuclease InsQ/TnpB family protein [Nitrososphaerales archaeon]